MVCVQHQEVASDCAFEVVGQLNVSGQEFTWQWKRRSGLVVLKTECRSSMKGAGGTRLAMGGG